VGLNSSETLGPRHSKARPKGWAYNRVPTVVVCQKNKEIIIGVLGMILNWCAYGNLVSVLVNGGISVSPQMINSAIFLSGVGSVI